MQEQSRIILDYPWVLIPLWTIRRFKSYKKLDSACSRGGTKHWASDATSPFFEVYLVCWMLKPKMAETKQIFPINFPDTKLNEARKWWKACEEHFQNADYFCFFCSRLWFLNTVSTVPSHFSLLSAVEVLRGDNKEKKNEEKKNKTCNQCMFGMFIYEL